MWARQSSEAEFLVVILLGIQPQATYSGITLAF